MSAIVAGAAGGLLVASVFICAAMMMLFALVRDAPPGFRPILQRFPPGRLALSVTFLAYPTWGVIGVVMGVLYNISVEQAPGSGMGSPNLVFTAAVLVVTAMLAAPFVLLLRRVMAGVLAIAIAAIGVFGWFLPYFAE